jgi:hypothetical protein
MSIQRGSDLIMNIIIPHLTRPAANRWTTVFPVVCSITLMLHFNGVFKKSVRHNLKDERANSDDENVLQDADALLGAPEDTIRYHRKLQATTSLTERERERERAHVWIITLTHNR